MEVAHQWVRGSFQFKWQEGSSQPIELAASSLLPPAVHKQTEIHDFYLLLHLVTGSPKVPFACHSQVLLIILSTNLYNPFCKAVKAHRHQSCGNEFHALITHWMEKRFLLSVMNVVPIKDHEHHAHQADVRWVNSNKSAALCVLTCLTHGKDVHI